MNQPLQNVNGLRVVPMGGTHTATRTPPARRDASEIARVVRLRAGDPDEAAAFVKDMADTVWRACCLFAGEGSEARIVFSEAMASLSANRFARLGGFSGPATLRSFVALIMRDLLAERVMRLLQSDPQKGWRAFQRLFEADIGRVIRKRFPGGANEAEAQDVYQDVSVALVENDYRRLKAYNGSGSFAGFVLRMVDRLSLDCLRKRVSRRRLPAAVLRLPMLEQEVFKLVTWQHLPARADLLQPLLRSSLGTVSSVEAIAAAIARVRQESLHAEAARHPPVSADRIEDIADDAATPEDRLVQGEDERHLAAALDVMKRAAALLTPPEKLYLSIVLSGAPRPSREIAELMQRPVDEIYKIKQRVLKRLRDSIADDVAVKSWRASV